LWKKLGFKSGMAVAVLNGPRDYRTLLADCPKDVSFRSEVNAADAIHFFVVAKTGLGQIAKLAKFLPPATILWVSWPKLSSPLSQDLREDDIRTAALACGLVDTKVCAVDADWSGLKLVRRKQP
jgi:hypothetical protein